MPDKKPPYPPFSSKNQPTKRRSKSTISASLIKQLQSERSMILEGSLKEIDGEPQPKGKKAKIEIIMPTAEVLAAAALRQAPKDVRWWTAVTNRAEGLPKQPIEMVEQEKETHDLSKLSPDELTEYISLEKRIAELLSKCSIEIESSTENTG